jgi:hypothetical protein
MSKPINKLVTQTRIKELLECYGSSASAWPAEERQAAMNLLKGSPELNVLRDQIQPLDSALMEYHDAEKNHTDSQAVQSLQQRIMSQLPDQELPESNTAHNDRSASHPHRFRFWTGSIAASIFIASLSFGIVHQLYQPENNSPTPPSTDIASNAFAQWAWEDITDEAFETEPENDPTTLFALVALELPAE